MGDKMGRFLTFLLGTFVIAQVSMAQVVVSEPSDVIVVHRVNSISTGPTGWWAISGSHVVRRDYAGNVYELGDIQVQVSGTNIPSTCFGLATNSSGAGKFALRINSGAFTFASGTIEPKMIIKVDDLKGCTSNLN